MQSPQIPENENERLRKLNDYGVLDSFVEREFDDIASLASKICNAPIALISLVDSDRQWFKSKIGLEVTETPRDISYCAHAILSDEIFQVEDSEKDERFSDNPLFLNSPNVRFYAGAPLITPEGYKIGTLCVIDNQARKLDENQLQSLRILSNNVVALLELKLKMKEMEDNDFILRDILDNTEDLIQNIKLSDGKILYANPSWLNSLEYTESEYKKLRFIDIIHPDSLEHCMDFYKRISNGESIENFEAIFISKSKKKFI